MRGIDTNPNNEPARVAAMTSEQPTTDGLFLYDHPASSYAQKVRMALRLKNIPFTKQTPQNLGLGNPDASFESANLRMEVPALIDGDFKVFESSVIVMYLEDKFPEPSILPKDPKERAIARMIEEMCDTAYEAINWALGEVFWFGRAEGAEAERIQAAAGDQTKQIHEWLSGYLGEKDFFNGGDSPGYADICVAPVLHRSVTRGLGPAEGSPLAKWHARMGKVPAIAETWREMEAGAQAMANAGPTYFAPHSGRKREYRDHRLEFLMKNGAAWIVNKGLEDENIRFGKFPKVN